MILSIALWVALSQDAEPAPDNRYMQVAQYGAASSTPDTTAAGGYAVSNNQPKPIWDTRLIGDGPKALLQVPRDRLVLTLGNGTQTDYWFRAADGNLLGYLEAKDARGVFRPIQYHAWSTCGNSYHRVALKPRHGWTFDIPLGAGPLKTVVRWRYRYQGYDLVSNEIVEQIPPTLFDIEPRLRSEHELWLTDDYPVLGRRGIKD